jgi:DNA gyrase subunit A
MLALVNNQSQPKTLSLKDILNEYIKFQIEVIVRRTEYDLRKARERAHILEGLRIAVDNIDEVIRIIRSSYNDAKERLMQRFELSEIQAQAILEMQLRRLQGLERDKIEKEYQELEEKIKYYCEILASDALVREILINELTEIRDKYGDDRKTEIAVVEDEIDIEDLIDEEDCVYTLTHAGYIKRMPVSTYKNQRRGGKGIFAMATREEDYVETIFTASTHDNILFFTNFGRVYRKKGYIIPEAGRTAKGTNIINILPIEQGEQVNAMIHIREFPQDKYLVMVTKTGTVKRMSFSELRNMKNVGIRAIKLDDGDELISVRETDGNQNIIIATHDGMAICFKETDVRPMGRAAAGVRGILLREGDFCVGAARCREGGCLLTVTENGYGKKTPINEYLRSGEEPQKRGGIGIKNYQVTEKTGKVAAVKVVDDNDDVLIISSDGVIIRMAAADINIYGRATQGVRVMRLDEGIKVISLARTEKETDEEDE